MSIAISKRVTRDEISRKARLRHSDEIVKDLFQVQDANVISEALSAAIGYKFHNRGILENALSLLSHKVSQQGLSCQRLEFLGDAFIDTFIGALGSIFPNGKGSELSELHQRSIYRGVFSTAAVNVGLEQHPDCPQSDRKLSMQAMVEGLELAKCEDGHRKVISTYWNRVNIHNKSACDAFESMVAAFLIDSDFDP
ncbi:hypothetical protein BGZ49_001018, partial [Haplosporangium sp. Z 27]